MASTVFVCCYLGVFVLSAGITGVTAWREAKHRRESKEDH